MANERKVGNIYIPDGVKMPRVRSHYDFSKSRNDAGGRKRRQARQETGEEESILRPYVRRQAISLARDMVRNNPQSRGLTRTLKTNIVGDYGKLIFNKLGDWEKKTQDWFNSNWARAADFRDGSTFRECLQLVVYALTHEGDFAVVFDDGLITGGKGTGRLVFFEADQICNLTEADFKPFEAKKFRQESGVIFDRFNRICGLVVTSKRGVDAVEKKDAWILTHDPASRTLPQWRFVRRKFRLVQARGSADAIPALQSAIDSYEMLGYEMATAKMASSRYASVIDPEGEAFGVPTGFTDFGEDGDAENEPTLEEEEEAYRASGLESYTGGNVDYLAHGAQIVFDPAARPNTNLESFLDFTNDLTGSSHGLAHAYSRMRADTSYTAFRGDMVMTWMAFKDFQQFLEDAFSDWVAIQAISWAIGTGEVDTPAEADWHKSIAWQYPIMPAVDEAKEQSALAQKLKNGQTTYAKLLGPSWREQLEQLAEELEFARELNLPLSIFETVAGAKADGEEKEEK